MSLETLPPGVVADGNAKVVFVPTIADPTAPTVAELTAAGVVPLTYSGSGDGYKHEITDNQQTITRWTARQQIQFSSTTTDTVTYTYVYDGVDDDDVARTALAEGTSGFVVERWVTPNEDAFAVDDLLHVVPIKCGVQAPDAPVTNQEQTITQKLNVTGTVQRWVKAVTGS